MGGCACGLPRVKLSVHSAAIDLLALSRPGGVSRTTGCYRSADCNASEVESRLGADVAPGVTHNLPLERVTVREGAERLCWALDQTHVVEDGSTENDVSDSVSCLVNQWVRGIRSSRIAACHAKTASTTADCRTSSILTESAKSAFVCLVRTS